MATSALDFHRDPSCGPPPVPLSGLIIFSHRSDAELIRSVHLYPGDGTFTAIQQEFRLSPTKYIRVSEPVDAFYSSNFTFDSSEQLLSMYKWLMLNEDPSWACILEFYGHCPYLTPIIPMLSVSRNPALYELPSLAYDLDFVEKAVYLRTHENQWNAPSGSHQPSQDFWLKQNELLSDDLNVSKSSCSPSNYNILPLVEIQEPNCCNEEKVSLLDFQVETKNAWGPGLDLINLNWSDQYEFTTERPLHLEQLNIWNSDIELGSSHELDFSTFNTSWTSCGALCNVSVPALESISSPTSSGITTPKADELWNSDNFLELRDQVLAGAEFEMEGLSLSNYVLEGSKDTSGSNAAKGVPSNSLEELSFDSIKNSGNVLKAHEISLVSSADGTRSCISEESVATANGDHSFVNHATSNSCSISSQVQKEKKRASTSPRDSRFETLIMSGKRDLKDVKRIDSSSHQRGPTERMMEISLEELSQYFHMPITQASKQLKVGLTVLKKRCREFGIPRWPHRKLKSLDSLIHNIQELAKSSQGKPPKDVMAAVRILEQQKKIMEETPGVELAERTKRLRQACFKASYKQRRQAQPHANLEPSHDPLLNTSQQQLQTDNRLFS